MARTELFTMGKRADQVGSPVFIACSCNLAELNELNKSINYSELARRLNIADGTTVKMHLSRYIERFRKPNREPEA